MILMNNSGEIRCWSLLGFKGKEKYRNIRNIIISRRGCMLHIVNIATSDKLIS